MKTDLVKFFEEREFQAFLANDKEAESIYRELSVDAYHDRIVDLSEVDEIKDENLNLQDRIEDLSRELEEAEEELEDYKEKVKAVKDLL